MKMTEESLKNLEWNTRLAREALVKNDEASLKLSVSLMRNCINNVAKDLGI